MPSVAPSLKLALVRVSAIVFLRVEFGASLPPVLRRVPRIPSAEYLMTARVLALAFLAALSFGRVAAAESYPSHPITLVVPFPAGGPAGTLGRIVGERMTRALGQSVVIDNASGAGGTVGTAKVARAPADGYTICVGQLNSHVFGPAVYATPYDVVGDFEPVGMI